MLLIVAVAIVLGMSIRSRWAMLLPLSVGVVAALALAAAGRDLSDTPIPFMIVTSTLAVAAGKLARSWLVSPAS